MDSLSSVSTSLVLPSGTPLRHHRRRVSLPSPSRRSTFSLSSPAHYSLQTSSSGRKLNRVTCKFSSIGQGAGDDDRDYDEDEEGEGKGNRKSGEELERALRLDGTIPGTSNEFVEQVSSRAYDMRRHLQQTFDSSSYDVLEANPWREDSKAVYVLTKRENELCTMKTRCNRSEVEKELGLLLSKDPKLRTQARKSTSTKFQMLVEDIREGVLGQGKATCRQPYLHFGNADSRTQTCLQCWLARYLKTRKKQQNTVICYEEVKVAKVLQRSMPRQYLISAGRRGLLLFCFEEGGHLLYPKT